jgi:O-glycosyl hydrolase
MNKNKFLFIGLLSALLVFGIVLTSCPGNEEVWEVTETLPELASLKIKNGKRNINAVNLGKPDKDPAKAEAGSVTLYTKTNTEPFTATSLQITPMTVSASDEVKFGSTFTDSPPDPDNYSKTAPTQLTDGNSLWIQVTDTEEQVSVYYVINIRVKYSPVEVFAIKKHPVSRNFTLADWNSADASAKTLSVEMEEDYSGYTYQWYSNTTFSNTGGSAISTAINASYTPNITAAGNTFYYVTVALSEENISSNTAMIKITSDAIEPAPTQFTIGDTRLNYVRGIGGTGSFMFREGSNADASPDADVKYIDLLFGELGCNILRIMVQDDYTNYITNSIQSRNSAQFYHNARDNFFPVIRKANEYGGYVFANPWTAPASMKSGNSLAGGTLTETGPNFVDYAEHLRDFLKWLNSNNAPIFALGILNEPDFGGGASYEGMGMSAEVTRDWFMTVGNFTTQKVTNRSGAGTTSSIFADDIIRGYGGGGATHHVLAMSGDSAGNIADYMNAQLDNSVSNNKIELMGRHYYSNNIRYAKVAGNPPHNASPTAWFNRPSLNYTGPKEAESLAMSPQMYAPGSTAGNIKREIWQTEHDFNFHNNSTEPPPKNAQNYWNSAFAALQDIDWALRVNGESVFCWWYSSSFSGFVTSYQPAGFPPYTITPRGRAIAHYARYANETWFLPITQTKQNVGSNMKFNNTTSFNAGATDPKISAFEDVNGKFISVVMYTPPRSTANGLIPSNFGAGGDNGRDDPTVGSANVGRVEVVLPDGFVASSVSAIRSYGNANSAGETWDDVPAGTPRYWIDEPVFLSADGKSVEVTLPGGNIISIMIKGSWPGREVASPERVRPYTVK